MTRNGRKKAIYESVSFQIRVYNIMYRPFNIKVQFISNKHLQRWLMRLSDEALEIPGNCQNTKTLFDNQEMLARVLEAVARALEAVARALEAVARAPEAVARVPRISILLLL